jgi:hypothetical protein
MEFYEDKANTNILYRLINGDPVIADKEDSVISLRIIDWFVTNYCKKNNIEFQNRSTRYNVYVDYRSQLKAFSKHNFDPFRRRDRIRYFYKDDAFVLTTVGQLNFFKWAIENGIVDYIFDHKHEIEEDMTSSYRELSSGPDALALSASSEEDEEAAPPPVPEPVEAEEPCGGRGSRKKRSELSKCFLKKININSTHRCLTFD